MARPGHITSGFLRHIQTHAETLNLLGLAALQLGEMDAAIDALSQAIESDGNNPGYFCNLGNVLYGRGSFGEAIAAYQQAISINPRFADAYSNLGAAFERQGKLDDAVAAYRRAIEVRPNFAQAYGNLGIALNRQGKFREAETAYRQAISITPNDAALYYNLGIALTEQGSVDAAVVAYRQALRIKPDYCEAYFNLGLSLKEQGKLDKSRLALTHAVELSPASPGNYRALADAKRFHPGDTHLASMERLAQRMSSLSPDDQIELHFGLAKAYDDINDYERSFRHLLAGNALKRQSIQYDEAATLDTFARTKEIFTLELMSRLHSIGATSSRPVFIVGMPRSGTTLIEQILASHPTVFGAGELNYINRSALKLNHSTGNVPSGFPEVVSYMTADEFLQFGSSYLTAVGALAPGADRIIDKMPSNFAYLGLIHLALPNARIIHVRRHPVDTCLSCFSKLFAGTQPYSYDLGELARFYKAYQSLMSHWRSILPAGVMLEVNYEDVVMDLETQARRIVRHCDLHWDDACLLFHLTKRSVRTASAIQVRQPIYSTSIGRWRSYGHVLGSLLELLVSDVTPDEDARRT